MNLEMSTTAEAGLELIKSLFAPGIGLVRANEPLDDTLVDPDEFDPDEYDDVFDYDCAWEANRWPSRRRFEGVHERVKLNLQRHPESKLMQRMAEVLDRILDEVFNGFQDHFYKQTRYDCLEWIAHNNVVGELRQLMLEAHNQS